MTAPASITAARVRAQLRRHGWEPLRSGRTGSTPGIRVERHVDPTLLTAIVRVDYDDTDEQAQVVDKLWALFTDQLGWRVTVLATPRLGPAALSVRVDVPTEGPPA